MLITMWSRGWSLQSSSESFFLSSFIDNEFSNPIQVTFAFTSLFHLEPKFLHSHFGKEQLKLTLKKLTTFGFFPVVALEAQGSDQSQPPKDHKANGQKYFSIKIPKTITATLGHWCCCCSLTTNDFCGSTGFIKPRGDITWRLSKVNTEQKNCLKL